MLSHSPVQAAIPCQFHTAKLGRGLSRSSRLTPSRLSQGRLLWTVSSGVLMISKDPPGNVCHAPHSKKGISCGPSHVPVPAASYLPWAPRTEQRGLCLSLCPTWSFSFLCQGKIPAFPLSMFRAVTQFQGKQSFVGSPSCWAQTSLAVRWFPWTSSGAVQKLDPLPRSRVRGISRCFLTVRVPASVAREAGGGWAGLPHPSGSAEYQHHLLGIGELTRPLGGQSTATKGVCPAWHNTSFTRQLKVY